MSLLLPLGLLGLLSLAVLLLIYILKPNYQQKLISSTYVWKLSLKYKRKRVPISRLRNLLLILCQIIILTMAAIILASPANVTEYPTDYNEKIIVIDASASMLAESDGETRFERAKKRAGEIAAETFDKNSTVTVIMAGREASYVAQRSVGQEKDDVIGLINSLECTYGAADMENAFKLAEETLEFNADSEVILLTGTDYVAANKRVKVDNVGKEGEWNAAILGVTAELDNGFYTIEIEVASYGADKALDVICEVSGINGTTGVTSLPIADLYCSNDETFKVIYTIDPDRAWGDNAVPIVLSDDRRIYSFDQIYIHIDEPDNYLYDNEFYLFDGKQPVVRIAYCSDQPNNFLGASLLQTVQNMHETWDIYVKEFNNSFPEFDTDEGKFDMYIFEHVMPEKLPKDGIVFMIDPDKPSGAGFTITRRDVKIPDWSGDGATLAAGVEHPIMNYVDASAFRLTSYTQIDENSLDTGYDVLMYYEGNPVFFVKDEPDSKIAVLSIDFKMSNLSVSMYFPMMLYNFFDYWLPATFDSNVYHIYDSVKLNARGATLKVVDPDSNEKTFDEFPSEYAVNGFGTYMVSQELISGATLTEQFYARIDPAQSNINRQDDVMLDPTVEDKPDRTFDMLVIWFAAVAVAILAIEWLLQSRSGI